MVWKVVSSSFCSLHLRLLFTFFECHSNDTLNQTEETRQQGAKIASFNYASLWWLRRQHETISAAFQAIGADLCSARQQISSSSLRRCEFHIPKDKLHLSLISYQWGKLSHLLAPTMPLSCLRISTKWNDEQTTLLYSFVQVVILI